MSSILQKVSELLDDGPIPWEVDTSPHVEWASTDTIRAFALGTGDDNPLYSDATAARASIHKGLIAPPLFLLATGTPPPVCDRPVPPDVLKFLRTKVRILGETWDFHSAVTPGDRLERHDELTRIEVVDPNDSVGGPTFDVMQVTTWLRDSEAVGCRTRRRRYGTPTPSPAPRPRASYSEDQINQIEDANLAEVRRGPLTRSHSDLSVGTDLVTIVRGPLTLTDLITYRAVVGKGPMRSGVLRLRSLAREAEPEMFSRDQSGAWDTIERLHWDDHHAIGRGHCGAYDYSHMRTVWLSQVLTDWSGDGAWLRSLTVESEGHCHVGDTQWINGHVTAIKMLPGDEAADVKVDFTFRNQAGDRTFRGVANVLLPDRESGMVTPTAADVLRRSDD